MKRRIGYGLCALILVIGVVGMLSVAVWAGVEQGIGVAIAVLLPAPAGIGIALLISWLVHAEDGDR